MLEFTEKAIKQILSDATVAIEIIQQQRKGSFIDEQLRLLRSH